MENKKYYKYLDFIRLLSCIMVFLYHLNILKGGYQAVCVFFVLTGYLSFISAYNKDDFSISRYYINRLKNIYLPFIIVVFITVFIISQIPSINWLNLKPETTSTVLGYNNFWQLNASLDYFQRHIDSPFMHFWYIGILLQFELIFPFIFLLIKKVNERFNKAIPLIFLIILSLLSTGYFVYSSINQNTMFVYYHTLTRIFSIIYGITLGYINCYYKKLVFNKSIGKFLFFIYLISIIGICFLVDSSYKYFYLFMILTSIISLRLIEYSTSFEETNLNIFDRIIKSLSSVSYEIYLIQYPVIFLFQEYSIDNKYSFLLIILITIVLSYILHFSLDYKFKDDKIKFLILKIILLTSLVLISIFGFCKYMISKDHTAELKELEAQLNSNQELLKEKQNMYSLKLKEEEDNWKLALSNLDNAESNLSEMVKNLHVVAIGDSVMLGAIKSIYNVFPNAYIDAKTSRTDWEANGILEKLKNKGILGEPIIFGLGTNGQCGDKCRVKILKTCEGKKMFWITTTNKKTSYINDQLKELAKKNNNIYIIDWEKESKDHNEYFISDKIHLTYAGKEAYSKFIYNEIYNTYLNEIKSKKNEMISSFEEQEKSKVVFYGNDLLLNSFDYLNESFKNSKFEISNYNYEELYNKLSNDINTNNLINKYVLLFDNNFKINETEYKNLITLLNGKEVYILYMNNKYNLNYNNVNVIDFYKEFIPVDDYLLVDRLHLSDKGYEYLISRLQKGLNN